MVAEWTPSGALSDCQPWELHQARRNAVAVMLGKAEELKPRKPKHEALVGGYRLASYRSRYDDEGEGYIKIRKVTITVELSGTLVGLAELNEWAGLKETDREDFFSFADGTSSEDSDMADIVGKFWGEDDWPGWYGNIVLFRRLAIDTSRDGGASALDAIGSFLEQEFARRASVLLLKAFPLEFEHTGSKIAPDRGRRLNRRREAMMRRYGARLSAQEFPRDPANVGWMWRAFRGPRPLSKPDPTWCNYLHATPMDVGSS